MMTPEMIIEQVRRKRQELKGDFDRWLRMELDGDDTQEEPKCVDINLLRKGINACDFDHYIRTGEVRFRPHDMDEK